MIYPTNCTTLDTPHSNAPVSLNGYTPAHFVNIYLDLDDKKWQNLLIKSLKNSKNPTLNLSNSF